VVVDGVVSGGTIRRASLAMVASYQSTWPRTTAIRALAQTDLVLVQLVGKHTGDALSTHGARQMLERAGRRAGLGLIKPHAFRHTWATALTEAPRRNTAPSPTRAGG
jgi:integrase